MIEDCILCARARERVSRLTSASILGVSERHSSCSSFIFPWNRADRVAGRIKTEFHRAEWIYRRRWHSHLQALLQRARHGGQWPLIWRRRTTSRGYKERQDFPDFHPAPRASCHPIPPLYLIPRPSRPTSPVSVSNNDRRCSQYIYIWTRDARERSAFGPSRCCLIPRSPSPFDNNNDNNNERRCFLPVEAATHDVAF